MATKLSDSYKDISDQGFSSKYIKSMNNLHTTKLQPKLNYASNIDLPRLSKINSSDLNKLINPFNFDYSFSETNSKNKTFWELVRTSDNGFKSWLIRITHKILETTENKVIKCTVTVGLGFIIILIKHLSFI